MKAIIYGVAVVLVAGNVASGSGPRGLAGSPPRTPARWGALNPPRHAAEISRARSAGASAPATVRSAGASAPATPFQNPQPAPTGNVARGKTLYDKTLRCYACHGFDGQTGNPRLAPMPRTEESFITYLRKPATPGMPAFADVPRQDLVDVYAYVKSLKTDAPSADSIPLLRDLIERATER